MGLDVTALQEAYKASDKDEMAWAAYNANGKDRMDGRSEGRYFGAKEFNFRAGSYGGYNEWRRWLCKKFLGVMPESVWSETERFVGKPFVELIDFGDNEGAIGTRTSAKLAKDFQDHADQLNDESGWNVTAYRSWQQAFELASLEGLVILH